MGVARQIRKRAKTERRQVALSEVLPELNFQFWEGPRRLPTLISLSGQAFGLLLIPTTQSPESCCLPKEALGGHVGHMRLELGVAHTGCGLERGHMYADGGEENLSELLSWEAPWRSRKSGLRARAVCLVLVLSLVSSSGSGSQKVFTK